MQLEELKSEALKILKDIKQMFSDKNNWCQRSYDKIDENGKEQHCLIGALRHLSDYYTSKNSTVYNYTKNILYKIAAKEYDSGIIKINDTLGYNTVMKLLDKTIESEKISL